MSVGTSEIHLHIKNMTSTQKKNFFNRTNQIRIFDCLKRAMNDPDELKLMEAQDFIALPHFSENSAES